MAEITKEELLARYAAGERDFSGLDFSRLDLSNIRDEIRIAEDYYAPGREDYPLNHCIFRGANFSYVNFSRTCIMDCDFRDTIFLRANLSLCAFSGSNFTGANMREVIFGWGEGIGAIFENVDFRGCNTIGNFVTEGTLYIRNCIGQKGEIINRFGQYIVIKELDKKSVDESNDVPIYCNGIPIDSIQPIGLSDTQPVNTKTMDETIDEDSLPF